MIKPAEWEPADGLLLEPNALRAAQEQARCLALTAGPGAGKTEMLAQRADFLLRTGSSRYPKRILAISFKVDASTNLRDRVKRRCGPDLAARFDSHTFHAFAKRLIDRFRPVLTGQDALDVDYKIGDRRVTRRQIEFSDLVPLAIQILKQSVIARNAVRQTYSHVFLDEFQDCTSIQYQLIKLAFKDTHAQLTAVGDTKQKIMAWAGAMEGIFATFATDFNARTLNLYRNFRSQPKLLRLQNEIIKVLDPAAVMPDEQIIGSAGEVNIAPFRTSADEAGRLADAVAEWMQGGVAPEEIAILFSRQPDLYGAELMSALEQRGIPYRNEQQLQDLASEPVACLTADYLRVLFGKREAAAWIRLMDALVPFADEDIRDDSRRNWQRFIKEQRAKAQMLDLIDNSFEAKWQLVAELLDRMGSPAVTALSPDYEAPARLEEVIEQVQTRIRELLEVAPELLDALGRFSGDGAVRLLTIHKSKGLEFDTVAILGVETETFWGKGDEERCAFFVGISRAKRRLVLTVCEERTRPSGARRWDTHRTPHREFLGYAQPFATPLE